MSEATYDSVEAWAGSTYVDADLPDAPKEPEDAPEKDPEVQEESRVTVYGIDSSEWDNKFQTLYNQQTALSDRIEILTGAVNQFGSMLDYIVQSVTEVGKSLSQGGLSGILSMLKGSANSD